MFKEPLPPPFSFSSPSPVLPFGGVVAKPVAGWLADRLARQRLVFLLALLLTGQLTLANFYLLLFPLSPLFPVFRVFYPALSTFSAVVCLSIASTPLPPRRFLLLHPAGVLHPRLLPRHLPLLPPLLPPQGGAPRGTLLEQYLI